jgi:hypothetical protein
MRVSKNQVTLLSAAVAALFAVGAQAQTVVTLPSSNPTVAASTALPYAREISAGQAIGAAAGYNVQTIVGIGTSSGQNRYVRVRLNNATFATAVVAANLTGTAGAAQAPSVAAAPVTVTVSQGGAVGSSFVIFQLTSNTNVNVNDGIVFVIPAGGVTIASTAAAASVTYEVYEFLAAAQAQTPVLYTATANLATFSPAVNLTNTVAAGQTQTATAVSSYLNVAGGVNATTQRAGIVNLAGLGSTAVNACAGAGPGAASLTLGLPFQANGTTCAFVSTVINSGLPAVMTVNGDFSAAASAASVTLGTTAATTVTPTSASITLTAGQAAGFLASTIGYVVNGTTQIPVSTYTTSLTASANPNYTLGTLGPITSATTSRDGVTYESPWVTVTPGFISRFFLTQTSPATVPWTAVVRNAAGLVTGGTLTGTLVSGRQTLVTMASLLPADTTAFPGPYQVTFSLASTAAQSQGAYVLTAPNGAVASTPFYQAALR